MRLFLFLFSASSKFVLKSDLHCVVKMAMGWLTAEEKNSYPWLIFFFFRKKEWSIIDEEHVVRRTAAACCVSESTVKCCRRGAKPLKETRLETVVKAQLGRPRISADDFTCSAIGTIVH